MRKAGLGGAWLSPPRGEGQRWAVFARGRERSSPSILLSLNCVHRDAVCLPRKHLVLATAGETPPGNPRDALLPQSRGCRVVQHRSVLVTLSFDVILFYVLVIIFCVVKTFLFLGRFTKVNIKPERSGV